MAVSAVVEQLPLGGAGPLILSLKQTNFGGAGPPDTFS